MGASSRWRRTRSASRSAAAASRPSRPPKRRMTVCTLTPASRATSSSETSAGRSQKSSTAASRMRSAVAAAACARATIRYGRGAATRADFMLETLTRNRAGRHAARAPPPTGSARSARCLARAGLIARWRIGEHQLWHRDEPEALRAQALDDLRHGGEGLRAVAAAVVHEHDRARLGLAQHRLHDRRGAGELVVLGVDVPEGHEQVVALEDADGRIVERVARRAEEA